MSQERLIYEINQYCSPSSILVINRKGQLVRIHCPFKVKALRTMGSITKGDYLDVTAVRMSQELKLVYVIDGQGYYHYHFVII